VSESLEPAAVRLLCTVTGSDGDFWGDLGFRYYEALYGAGISTRVFSNGAASLAVGRWAVHGPDFLRPVAQRYVNVMIAPIDNIAIALSAKNVAVTVSVPSLTRNRLCVVGLCDVLGAPDAAEAVALQNLGLKKARMITPGLFSQAVARLLA
jgi:hypothetical protein